MAYGHWLTQRRELCVGLRRTGGAAEPKAPPHGHEEAGGGRANEQLAVWQIALLAVIAAAAAMVLGSIATHGKWWHLVQTNHKRRRRIALGDFTRVAPATPPSPSPTTSDVEPYQQPSEAWVP